MIDFEELKKKGAKRKEKRKEEIQSKMKDFECWVANNPQLASILIPGGIMLGGALIKGGVSLGKSAIQNSTAKAQNRVDDRRIYDPSEGFYWNLKRDLNTSQKLELERRKADGESMGQILEDMRVLK